MNNEFNSAQSALPTEAELAAMGTGGGERRVSTNDLAAIAQRGEASANMMVTIKVAVDYAQKCVIEERKRLDPKRMRNMLEVMQAGEMSVSRGVELLDMWLYNNYDDDQLPVPVPGRKLQPDELPWDVINNLRKQLEAYKLDIKYLKGELERVEAKIAHPDAALQEALKRREAEVRAEMDEKISSLENESQQKTRFAESLAADVEKLETSQRIHLQELIALRPLAKSYLNLLTSRSEGSIWP